jgi:hypothetical protein
MNLNQILTAHSYSLYPDVTLFRVQRTARRHTGPRVGAVHLPPLGLLKGRFDLAEHHTGYFALTPDTACYEALCRREASWVSVAMLKERELLTTHVKRPLKLLNLLSASSSWPVLQSLKFSQTQPLAAHAHEAGFDGIAYLSSQHSQAVCIALFGDALTGIKRGAKSSLVMAADNETHPALADAIRGSGVSVVP